MLMRGTRQAIYDVGFYNLGVVPTAHDNGAGAKDPFGNSLSFTPQYIASRFVDNFGVEPCLFELDGGLCLDDSPARRAQQNSAITGTFKTPTLRNVTLTGPYMHNGSLATLEQVVDFYNRGGNVDNFDKHPAIVPLGLTDQEKADLVAFMRMFTDDRVAFKRAPFDHPSLNVPNGHVGNQASVTPGNPLLASFGLDETKLIPAVGGGGTTTALPTFVAGLAGAPQPPVVVPSFNLTASPTTLSFPFLVTTTSSSIQVTPVNGFASTVTFSASVPAGVSTSFSRATVTGSGVSVLTLRRSLLADPRGVVTVTATSSGITRSVNITLR